MSLLRRGLSIPGNIFGNTSGHTPGVIAHLQCQQGLLRGCERLWHENHVVWTVDPKKCANSQPSLYVTMLSRNISTLHQKLWRNKWRESRGPPNPPSESITVPAEPCASLPQVVLRPQWLTHRPPAYPIPYRPENPSPVPTECRYPPGSTRSTRQEHHL